VGTLFSELAPQAERLSARPRMYVDANVPAGLVGFMRGRLGWDVLFVIEEPDLRRASDRRHYELAHQLRRTLITLDRDYLDDGRFPPLHGSGVIVVQAPSERQLRDLLIRVDQTIFAEAGPLPVAGRKLQLHTDWGRQPAVPADRPADTQANALPSGTV
jgi:hypothetical protein